MAKFLKLSLGRRAEPDDDLDFPDFDFDNPDVADDRSPVVKAALAAKDGFTEKLKDKSLLQEKLKENLPSEFGEAADFASNTLGETKEFIKKSVKDLKPAAANISKSIKAFLPANFTRISAKLDQMENWANSDKREKGPTVEQQREQDIGINVGRIFQQQALQDENNEAKDDAKEKFDQAIEFGRHKNQISVLNAINKAVTGTGNYTTKINSEFQRKSLELQYRLLFATRDILETSKKSYEDSKTLLTGISKNTALPEYVKLRNSERFMEQSRNKFMNHSLDTVSGYGKRMINRVKDEVTGGVSMVNDIAGLASFGTEMTQMLEEIEGKKTMGEKGGKAGGGFLAGKLLDFAIGKGGAKLKENPQRLDAFAKIANKLGYLMGNKERLIKDTEDFDEEDPNFIKRNIGKFTRNFSGSQGIDLSMKRTGIDEMGQPSVFTNLVSKSITDIIPGYLAKILKEVSTSNAGQNPTGTGKKEADTLTYDHQRGRFIKEKTLIRLHQRKFERGNKSVEDSVKPILTQIESVNELSDEERSQVSKFLMDYSMNGYSFNIEKFSKPETFARRLTPELGAKISDSFVKVKEKLVPGSAEYERQQKKMAQAFNNVAKNMSTNAKDAQDLVTFGQEHIARKSGLIKNGKYNLSGQKDHIARRIKAPGPLEERTEEQIRRDNESDTEPNDIDALYRQRALAAGSTFETKDDGTTIETKRDGSTIETKPDGTKIKRDQFGTEITSDIMAKEDIRLTKKNSFLGKLSKLKMYDWKYKKNHEADDGGVPHIGPMAQNVNDVVGSEAAPGGTKIDMVNMNGFLTGAVQELSGKVDDIETKRGQGAVPPPVAPVVNRLAPDYVTTLTEQIRDNTKRIADGTFLSLSMLGKFDLSKMDFSNFNIAEALKSAKDSAKEKIKSGSQWGYDYVKDGSIKSNLHGLANAGLNAAQGVVSVGKATGSFAKTLATKGFTGVKDTSKWLWENPMKSAGEYLSSRKEKISNAVDVFVKPDEAPRMTYSKIKNGDYVQLNEPDKPLNTKELISNVDSDILDTKSGVTVIYRAELNDMYFKLIGKNKLTSAVKKIGEKVNNGRKRFQAFIPVAYTFAWDISKKLYKTVLNWVEGPTDVYVKGEQVPRLFKHAMVKGSYIRASDSKVIERPSQIDGMVYDTNQQVVISFEDFQLGLVNSKGEPFTGPIKKIISKGKNLLSSFSRKLKSGGKRILGGLASIGKTAINIAAHGVVGATGAVSGVSGMFNSEGTDILKSIRDILDARLPGGGGIGIGNKKTDDAGNEIVGPKNGNTNSNKAKSEGLTQTVKQYTGGGNVIDQLKTASDKTKSLGKKLWNRVKTRKEAVVTDVVESESVQKIKELKTQTKKELARLKKETTAAALKAKKDSVVDKVQGLREKAAGRIGGWQSMKERVNVNKADHSKELDAVRKYEIKNTFTLIADMIKGVKNKVASFFGMGEDDEGGMPDFDLGGEDDDPRRRRRSRRGQVRRGRMGRGARRGLRGMRNLGSRFGGAVARHAPTVARVGGAALGGLGRATGSLIGGTAGLAGRALLGTGGMLVRGGIMAAGAIPGLASAAAGAASAVAGAISLPVVAGIVVAGALVYGGYKLYQHLSKKKWNDVETFRMLEYGLRGGDTDAMKKVYTLEKMLTDSSSVTETDVSLDNKKVDAVEIYKLFGVEPTPQSQEDHDRLHAFNTWYEKRFTPVFHKWLKASYKAYGKKGLDELESKDVDKHYQVVKGVSQDNTGWDITFSPFNLSNLNTDTEVIGGFRKALLAKLSKEAKPEDDTKKSQSMASEAVAAGLGAKALTADGAVQAAKAKTDQNTSFTSKALSAIKTAFGYTPAAMAVVGIGKATGWFTEKAGPGIKFVLSSPKNLFNHVFGKSVSALEAVKMRAYGMGTLDKSKVNHLRKLEDLVSVHTKFNSDGTLSWDGDLEALAGGARKLFGIAVDDVAQNKALLDYISGRFLPIYLMYYNGVNSLLGKSDISLLQASESLVKGSEAVEIANRLIGSSEHWAKDSSPWKDYDLNTDASSARENVAYLLEQSKRETLPEEKKLESKTPSANTAPGSPGNPNYTPDKPKPTGGFFKNLFKPSEPEGHPEAEARQTSGPTGGGQPAAAPTTGGSVGKLVMAGGELATGSGASKFMKLKGGANVTNMNPDFMKLFNGMVEEYGQKSGKSIQVNSGWRSTAAQAELYRTLPKGQAARPGNSLHEFGLAMDVSPADLDAMDKVGLLRKYGFTRPIAKEPWHIEPVGLNSPQLVASAKTNPEVARTAIEASIGRGGGGVGDTQRDAKSYFRDWKVHNQIFNSNVPPSKEEQETLLASLPASGYAAGVDQLKGNQVTASASAPSSTSTGSSSAPGNLAAAPEGEINKDGPKLGTAQASGIVKPEQGFEANGNKLATLQESGSTGGKLWKDLPNSNGASWQAQGPMIEQAAKMVGLDPALGASIAAKESGFNPTSMSKEAGPNAARGMYQFKPATFNEMVKKYGAKYGIDAQNANIMDPRQSALMGMHYVKQGMSSAGDKSPGWAYLTHFLGQGGNLNTFKSLGEQEIAATALPGPAAQNVPVFYHGGKKNAPRTKAEIIAFADTELQRKLSEFKVPLALNGAGGVKPQSEQATAVAQATPAASAAAAPGASASVPAAPVTPATQVASIQPSTEMTKVAYKPGLASKASIDISNPAYQPAEQAPARKPTTGFGIFNTPTNEQVAAANQPMQKGSDPSRDFKGLGETNEILSKQLTVLGDIKGLAAQIVAGILGMNRESSTAQAVNVNAQKPKEPSNVRQNHIPTTQMSAAMVSRARTIV